MNEQERMVSLMEASSTQKKLIKDLQQASGALTHTDYIDGAENLKDDALELKKSINSFIKRIKK